VVLPLAANMDVLALADGMQPKRVRIPSDAGFRNEPTGPRLPLSIELTAATSTSSRKIPGAEGAAAKLLGFGDEHARGMVSFTTTPAGASLWLVVDPRAIGGLPCGAPIDLQIVSTSPAGNASPRTMRVEWSAFSGSPPRASVKG